MSISFERAALLLAVADRCRAWPNLGSIHDAAMTELQDISDKAGVELAEARKVAAAKVAADKAQKAQADAAAATRGTPVAIPAHAP